jgi:hypothetical protein
MAVPGATAVEISSSATSQLNVTLAVIEDLGRRLCGITREIHRKFLAPLSAPKKT